jgi:hypothetical protein
VPPNSLQDIWSKIFIIERDLLENQKSINRQDASYVELLKKIDSLKDDIRQHKNFDELDQRIKDLEILVDDLRQEMPEMRLIRKMVFALVAFILTAVMGLLWNNAIIDSSRNASMRSVDEISRKVLEEYTKEQK